MKILKNIIKTTNLSIIPIYIILFGPYELNLFLNCFYVSQYFIYGIYVTNLPLFLHFLFVHVYGFILSY